MTLPISCAAAEADLCRSRKAIARWVMNRVFAHLPSAHLARLYNSIVSSPQTQKLITLNKLRCYVRREAGFKTNLEKHFVTWISWHWPLLKIIEKDYLFLFVMSKLTNYLPVTVTSHISSLEFWRQNCRCRCIHKYFTQKTFLGLFLVSTNKSFVG